jgi:hypothetical protein
MTKGLVAAEARLYWIAASRFRELKRQNGNVKEMADCADELAAVALYSDWPLLKVRTEAMIREMPKGDGCASLA